jgi:uncharacterized protein (TIGR02217 family)
MAFDEVRFPVSIARRASGGPERRTKIVALGSGAEERNSRWAHSRRRYDAGLGVRSLDDVHEVIAFFEERRGRLHGFRWKDYADFKSSAPGESVTMLDQALGLGDGVQANFDLVKTYGSVVRPYVRRVTKPVQGSVVVAVAGIAASAFTVDWITGVVTFGGAAIPPVGAAVTAGFEFDVPVRFDTDRLTVDLAAFNAGGIPNIPVLEVRV